MVVYLLLHNYMTNNKKRPINTRLWNDTFIAELDPTEKLLFVYFLTNEHTNVSGIYELPLKVVAMETGIDAGMVKNILGRLKDRIRHIKGYVVVRNWLKHQAVASENIQKGISNCWDDLEKDWLKDLVEKKLYHIPRDLADTTYKPLISSLKYLDSYLDSNSDLDSDSVKASGPASKGKFTALGAEVIKAFEEVDPKNKNYYSNTTQRKAADFLVKEYTFDVVLSVVKILPETNKMAYFPSITNPYELQERWVKLGDAYAKEQNNKSSKVKDKLKNVIW